jgi:hypothetical protein
MSNVIRIMSDSNEQLAKIKLRHEDGEEVFVETPWAKRVGTNLYELDNLPWYAYGVSCGDVVEAVPAADGLPEFRRVVRKSGNRTVRVVLKPQASESSESKALLDDLQSMGCDYEGMNHSYIAVNIPPSVDFWRVCEFLTNTGQNWEHADPTYAELHHEKETG